MKRIIPFFILSLLCFSSCREKQKPRTFIRQSKTSDSPAGRNRYIHFTGTINNKPVTADLIYCDSIWSGYYYFDDEGKPVMLRSYSKSPSSGNIRLVEFFVIVPSDTINNQWILNMGEGTANGFWNSMDGTVSYAVSLREDTAASSALEVLFHTERAPYHEELDEPAATSTHRLVWYKTGDTSGNAFINAKILGMIGCDTLHADDAWNCIGSRNGHYFKEYRESLDALNDEELLTNPANNFYAETAVQVLHHANGWLVLEQTESEYTGGAHPNATTFYFNLDVRDKKLWKLQDVMNVDSNKLRVLADIAVRRYFSLSDTDALEKRLLVSEITLTDNFFLMPKGLVFCYQPYEIASYADGPICLFIPYTELKDMLTEAFKKRMNLLLPSVSNGKA